MLGLFFGLLVTPVLPAQSPPAMSLQIRQEPQMCDSSPEGLSTENVCAGKESPHMFACTAATFALTTP